MKIKILTNICLATFAINVKNFKLTTKKISKMRLKKKINKNFAIDYKN